MRSPLLRETESFTLSGKPACARPLGDIAVPRIGSMLLFHYPSTWNHLLRDHATSFQVTPLSPQETQVTTRSEEHTSELQSLMRNQYAVCCLNKQTTHTNIKHLHT